MACFATDSLSKVVRLCALVILCLSPAPTCAQIAQSSETLNDIALLDQQAKGGHAFVPAGASPAEDRFWVVEDNPVRPVTFHANLPRETLHVTPTFKRINYARESLVLGLSLQATPESRHYAEVAWANSVAGGAKPLPFQLGTEYSAIAERPLDGAPFAAVNVHLREEVHYAAGVNVLAGWQWKSPESARAIRVGAQYYNGPSYQFEFFQRYDNQLGFGIWYDY